MSRTIAHIINPVRVPPTSDLHVAQPITFETMRRARELAQGTVAVQLFSTQYPEDHEAVPSGFEICPDLTRSILDLGRFERPRKLPVLADILERLSDAAPQAEYLVYTNVDIALRPEFYVEVNRLIDEGFDAFVINRRTISAAHSRIENIPQMLAEPGKLHPGHDCFVFRREAFERYFLADVCLGVAGVGRALILNLACHSGRFAEFKEKRLTFHLGDDKIWKSDALSDYAEFGRREVDRVVAKLESDFGPIASIPSAAEYLPHWHSGVSNSRDCPISWTRRLSRLIRRRRIQE